MRFKNKNKLVNNFFVIVDDNNKLERPSVGIECWMLVVLAVLVCLGHPFVRCPLVYQQSASMGMHKMGDIVGFMHRFWRNGGEWRWGSFYPILIMSLILIRSTALETSAYDHKCHNEEKLKQPTLEMDVWGKGKGRNNHRWKEGDNMCMTCVYHRVLLETWGSPWWTKQK